MNRTLTIFSILTLAVILSGCNKDEQKLPDSTLSFSFTEAGFTAGDNSEAFLTGLTAGDRVALFAVENGAVVETVNNLCVTATESGWTISDASMLFPQGAVYYAYFPYQENLTASVNPAGTSAEEFFEGLVSSWTLPADQSGDAFKASDLMIGSASVESEAVNMTLSHAMALAAVELPGKVYTFTNTDVQIPDYSLTADAEFDEIVPFKSSGLFLCLVKPGDFSLSGSIGGESWSFDGNAVAGAYMLHSEGEAEVIEHQLQIGDFFLADGSLLSKDAPASEVSAAHVLGVVCQYDPDRIGKGEKEALGGTAHALVLGNMLAGANGNPYVYMQYRFYTDYSIQDTDFDNSYVRDEEGEIGFPRVPQEKSEALSMVYPPAGSCPPADSTSMQSAISAISSWMQAMYPSQVDLKVR